MAPTTIATERLDLVALGADEMGSWVAGDAEALSRQTGAVFPAPPKAPPLFEDDLVGMSEMMTREGHRNAVWLMVERQSRRPVGIAGINTGHGPATALTGYSVYPDEQGKGFATEALKGLAAWLFGTTSVTVLRATIPPWNRASIRVADKLGMKATGTSHDPEVGEVLVYELRKVPL